MSSGKRLVSGILGAILALGGVGAERVSRSDSSSAGKKVAIGGVVFGVPAIAFVLWKSCKGQGKLDPIKVSSPDVEKVLSDDELLSELGKQGERILLSMGKNIIAHDPVGQLVLLGCPVKNGTKSFFEGVRIWRLESWNGDVSTMELMAQFDGKIYSRLQVAPGDIGNISLECAKLLIMALLNYLGENTLEISAKKLADIVSENEKMLCAALSREKKFLEN